jgi:ankyrin repeat protein
MSSNRVTIHLICLAFLITCACTLSPEEARAKIDARELPFDEDGIATAVMNNDTKLVKLFITAGYDVNTYNDARRAPLMLATRLSYEPILKLVIAAGARAEQLPGVLEIPAGRGDLETMTMLLDAGAEIDSVEAYGRTALLVAVEAGNVEAVRFLLGHGADPDDNATGPRRRDVSPLIQAVRTNQPEIVQSLIDAGADPRKSVGGIDAIQAAQRSGYEELAQRLQETSEN